MIRVRGVEWNLGGVLLMAVLIFGATIPNGGWFIGLGVALFALALGASGELS